MKNLLIAFVLILTSTMSLQAQTPQGFNYQATVRNADGALASSNPIFSEDWWLILSIKTIGASTSDEMLLEAE